MSAVITPARVHPDFTTSSTSGEGLPANDCKQRKSHVGVQLKDPKQAQKGLELQTVDPEVLDKLSTRFMQLGMLSEAVDGWAQYHVNPVSAIVYHMACHCFMFALTVSMVLGVPMYSFPAISWMVGLVIQLGHIAMTWRVCSERVKLLNLDNARLGILD